MTTRILPSVTSPWPVMIRRRHSPPQREGRFGYQQFRQCLRWEFGFTCAFCLCHESDLSLHGVESTGLTWIEHFVPLAVAPELVNDYANCFYTCRFCNQDRGTLANLDPEQGGRLLNPCAVVWADHFERIGDDLAARPENRDATYTHQAYNLDHPRKVEMRRFRRVFATYLQIVEEGPRLHERLLDRAAETGDPSFLEEAQQLALFIRLAYDFLVRYPVIPRDRQPVCLCGDEGLCKIPESLSLQAVSIEPPRI